MQNTIINEELELTYPDGFRIMSRDELKQAYGMNYAEMWGILDENRHMVFTVIWKESFEAAQKLMSTNALVKRNEKAMRKAFRKQGYSCDEFFDCNLAGRDAQGFRYSYQVNGVWQACETTILRYGKCCYTLYYYTRSELAEENRGTYEDMLSSLALP